MPPVLRCADVNALIAHLASDERWRGLLSAGAQNAAGAVLAAPAALARGIALFAPSLAQRSALSVLVIGAEATDAADQGRWYQAVGALLGCGAAIHVTLVGGELDPTFSSALAAVAPGTPATSLRTSLADFLLLHPVPTFDVAVMFQPGFQKYRDWLAAPGLVTLLKAGTVVVGSSYSSDEYEMERWVLECHGYRVSEICADNPFSLELGDRHSAIRWGGVLWQVSAAPAEERQPDEQGLQALALLNRMVAHSMTVAGEPSPPLGTAVDFSAEKGKQISLIHIFDRRFVDPVSAAWYRLGDDGVLQKRGRLPVAEIAAYPGQSSRDIERAVWAAGIKARHLLTDYPAVPANADAVLQPGGMFTALRARAAQLFR